MKLVTPSQYSRYHFIHTERTPFLRGRSIEQRAQGSNVAQEVIVFVPHRLQSSQRRYIAREKDIEVLCCARGKLESRTSLFEDEKHVLMIPD